MIAYSIQEIKNAEKEIIESGVSEEVLIDRASDCLYNVVKNYTGMKVFLVGGGNNGSDALACAIKIKDKVKIYIANVKRNAINSLLLQKASKIHEVLPLTDFNGEGDVIIDGLLGSGLSRELGEEICNALKIANDSNAYRIAIDIPSGLDDLGLAKPIAFCAHETVVLGGVKESNILNDAPDYCNKLTVCDIGLNLKGGTKVINEKSVSIPKRKRNTHKGKYGKIKIVGGSERYVSAPLFSALACLRTGAGLTTLTIPNSLKYFYSLSSHYGYTLDFLPENEKGVVFCTSKANEIISNATTIVVGMGMGDNEVTAKYVEYFINNFDGILVIDADGINALSKNVEMLKSTNRKAKIILTPHIGEYERLNSNSDLRPFKVKEWAKANDVVMVLKSSTSIITDGESVSVSVVGTPALAKGGSGDILAGIIGALTSITDRKIAVETACVLLGLGGKIASEKAGNESSVIPLDIINSIGDAITKLQ